MLATWGAGFPFSPSSLFSAGETGAWYDPSDYSTLFEDSAGTTPITTPLEKPVGLMLDKSRGLVLGSELVGPTATPSTKEVVWTSLGGGSYSCNGSGYLKFSGLTQGKTYLVSFSVSSYTSGTLVGYVKTTWDWTINSVTTYTARLVCGANNDISFYGSSFVGTLTNISVRELPGNHATQSVTTSRPILSARKNLLVGTATLSTQTVATTAVGYVLSFWGTGTVTLSGTSTAGPLIGTGVNDRVSLTFTPTAGTLTLTVSGSVTKAQLEMINETV